MAVARLVYLIPSETILLGRLFMTMQLTVRPGHWPAESGTGQLPRHRVWPMSLISHVPKVLLSRPKPPVRKPSRQQLLARLRERRPRKHPRPPKIPSHRQLSQLAVTAAPHPFIAGRLL